MTALILLFNFSMQQSVVPTAFKIAKGSCLFKRGDPSSPTSFRLISITSVAARILEHIIKPRLVSMIEPSLSAHQHGFRKNHQVYDVIHALLSRVYSAFTHHSFMWSAFLDLVQAFDHVDHDILLLKLQRMGVSNGMLRWLSAFLSDRLFCVNHQGECSGNVPAKGGVPQGCVLSPIRFIAFINDLAMLILTNTQCLVLLFADDITILAPEGEAGVKALQAALSICAEWAVEHRMQFSADKSSVVCFKRQNPLQHTFKLGSFNLVQKPSATCLGFVLNERGCWDEHVNKITRKLNFTAYLLCRLLRISPSLSPAAVRNIVCTTLYSIVAYSIAFCRPSDKQLHSFDSLICRPIRACLRLPRSTALDSIMAEFGLLPCRLLHQQRLLIYRQRLMSFGDSHPGNALLQHERERRFEGVIYRQSIAHETTSIMREWSANIDRKSNIKAIAATRLLMELKANDRSLCQWKSTPGLSPYLRHDDRHAAAVRARLRFNRSAALVKSDRTGPRRDGVTYCNYCLTNLNVIYHETVEHILLDCGAYDRSRRSLCERLADAGIKLSPARIMGEVSDLKGKVATAVLDCTAEFLQAVDTIRNL